MSAQDIANATNRATAVRVRVKVEDKLDLIAEALVHVCNALKDVDGDISVIRAATKGPADRTHEGLRAERGLGALSI